MKRLRMISSNHFSLIVVLLLVLLGVGSVVATSVEIYPSSLQDGYAARAAQNATWTNVRDGAGTYSSATTASSYVMLKSANITNTWAQISRTVIIFDTSVIPAGAVIDSATIQINRSSAYTTHGDTGINIVKFDIDGAISNEDYDNFGTDRFSTDQNASTFNTLKNYTFSLNELGLSNISKTGVSGFGIRTGFDIDNIAPPWIVTTADTGVSTYTADSAPISTPRLNVTYHIPEDQVCSIDPTTGTYSFVHLSDLQGLASSYPEILNETYREIEGYKTECNITAILDSGDLTNGFASVAGDPSHDFRAYTAENATGYTTIPIRAVTGNHDVNNTGDFTQWDAWIPNGPAMHDYSYDLEDFAVYGLAWNGTSGTSGEIALNATAREQMQTYFAANPSKIPVVLNHAYMTGAGTVLAVGTDIRNALQGNGIILSGHYYPTHAMGNIIRQTDYNGSVLLEDQWNPQDISPYSIAGGRIYIVYKSGDTIENVTTRDVYSYPEFVVNNTQVWQIGEDAAPDSIANLANNTPTCNSLGWTFTRPTDPDYNGVGILQNGTWVNGTNTTTSVSWTGLPNGTVMMFNSTTFDLYGNQNLTHWQNASATTDDFCDDGLPPGPITNLANSTPTNNTIVWSWDNPIDADYSHLMIYRNNTFWTNSSNTTTERTWNQLPPNTNMTFSSRTCDFLICSDTWVNKSANTTYEECDIPTPTPTITVTPTPTSQPAASKSAMQTSATGSLSVFSFLIIGIALAVIGGVVVLLWYNRDGDTMLAWIVGGLIAIIACVVIFALATMIIGFIL